MDDDVPPEQRDLLRLMMTEQLSASLPLDLTGQSGDATGQDDWTTRMVSIAHRSTVAICPNERMYSWVDFEARLRNRVPDVSIVHLTTPASAVLWQPDEISDLVRNLLQS